MNSGKIRRIAALSNAALEKKRLATEATDKAIRNLTSLNQSITVANVARLAGVSTSYIYKYPELKERIDSLRNQQVPVRTSQKAASNNSQTTIIYTLREEIKRLNTMLGESKNANQLLIGKIYQQQETQNLIGYFKSENKKQAQQIQELQNEIDIIKQELQFFQATKVHHPKIIPLNNNIVSEKIIDITIYSEIKSQLELVGIKLNPTLTKLIESSSVQQVKNAISIVQETLLTGTKIRSKVGLFRKALESNWMPSQLDEERDVNQLEATFSEWYKLAKASGLVIASQKTEEGIIVYEPNGQAISFENMLERGWTLDYLQLQNQR
jgi:ribosomal protein L29